MNEPIRVLHVDDDTNWLGLTATRLEGAADRIDVRSETDPSEVCPILERESIDCIVSDYRLTSTNGIDLLRQVREKYPKLPFILYTGRGTEAIASEAISAGVTDYVQKSGQADDYELLATRIVTAVEEMRAAKRAREYESALEQTRDQLRQVIDLVPDLIFAKNGDGEYILANEATAEYYGRTPDEVEGKTVLDLPPTGSQAQQFLDDDQDVIDSGEQKFVPEEELTTADGETRILQTTKIPYEPVKGGDKAVLGYARDVTELKAYERQLETQRDNLTILNQIVRHDIRNELQLALSHAEDVAEHVDEDDREDVEQVLASVRRTMEVTEDARDVAEVMMEANTDLVPVELRPTLEAELEEMRSTYENAVVTVDGSIPAVTVVANDLLSSVYRNLLTNAITHNGAEEPVVTVSAAEADGDAVVRIADNGPGIADDRTEKIFEEGYTGTASQGDGIGLYLVETLVDRYGGTVRVENDEPTGTIFTVRLPIAD
ncbi:ATP-binding protein [Natrialbaceae archaeon A-arb3/5]